MFLNILAHRSRAGHLESGYCRVFHGTRGRQIAGRFLDLPGTFEQTVRRQVIFLSYF